MKLIIISAWLSINIGINKEVKKVSYTVYNAIEGQTDRTPLTTADGSKIIKPITYKWIAVSRDLLKKYPYGSVINLCGCNDSKYNGRWLVHDTMNKRFTNKIDFLVDDSIKLGKGNCYIKK